jgi:stage II sporulation protein D
VKNILRKILKSYILLFLVLIIVAIIILPLLLTQKFIIENTTQQINIEVKKEEIDYNVKYKTINLLHKVDNTSEDIELDEYIVNVVAAEMPVDYELEALKAQATVARTYTLYQIENGKKHANNDICDDSTCCQAWISKEKRFERWDSNQEEKWNKLREAVYASAGDIITYEGKPIDAFFHSNSGGKTELPVNVWGGNNFPYLQTVETARRRRIFAILFIS